MKNTKTLRIMAIAAVSVLLIVAATAAVAQGAGQGKGYGRGHGHGSGHGPWHGEGGGQGLHRMLSQLDLSAEQQEQIYAMFQEHRASTESVRQELRDAHRKVMELTHAETLDENAIRQAVEDAAVLQADMAVDGARMFQQLRGVLTDEQRQQLDEIRAEQLEWRENRMQRRGQGPGGPQGDRLGDTEIDS
jgi:Spy/CpxP family protein refolding chaperone